jgi:hypothetical protein
MASERSQDCAPTGDARVGATLLTPYSLKKDSGRDTGIGSFHGLVCETSPMRLNGSPDCNNTLQNNALSGTE